MDVDVDVEVERVLAEFNRATRSMPPHHQDRFAAWARDRALARVESGVPITDPHHFKREADLFLGLEAERELKNMRIHVIAIRERAGIPPFLARAWREFWEAKPPRTGAPTQ